MACIKLAASMHEEDDLVGLARVTDSQLSLLWLVAAVVGPQANRRRQRGRECGHEIAETGLGVAALAIEGQQLIAGHLLLREVGDEPEMARKQLAGDLLDDEDDVPGSITSPLAKW